jgi:hypothetical protein
MADAIGQGPDRSAVATWEAAFAQAAGLPVLFGLRLWASVCLALYVAFWLQLDKPFWAGLSAAIVCQPHLGASLRKGWFLMIGTVVGATMIVVLTAFFPQDRIAFLGLLAVWSGICAFVATVLHNFASYSAANAGFTAAIIAADNLGATGGPNSDVFMLAVTRASVICIGIVCAGIVLAGKTLARQATRRSQYSRTMSPSRKTAAPRGWNGPTVWTFDAKRARSRSRSLRTAGSSDHPRSISQYHRELSPRAV